MRRVTIFQEVGHSRPITSVLEKRINEFLAMPAPGDLKDTTLYMSSTSNVSGTFILTIAIFEEFD